MSYSRTARAGSTTTNARTSTGAAPTGDAPRCNDGEPAIRLLCKNGQNQGRYFWKCARTDNKCRFFQWEDQMKPSSSASRFPGGAGHVLGSSQQQPDQPSASQASSSSTEASTLHPSTPLKRRRPSWSADHAADGAQARHLPSTPSKRPAIVASQTPEEALNDGWDEDIEDFDDSQTRLAGAGNGDNNGKAKAAFTSFGATTSPKKEQTISDAQLLKTPPRLAPGLPVTPTSAPKPTGQTSGSATRSDQWQKLLADPSYSARVNAMTNGSSQTSTSPSTASLLDPVTPSKQPGAPDDAPDTSSSRIRNISTLFSEFSTNVTSELSSATKTAETLERQLKAAQMKAAFHEKREKETRKELEEVKEFLRLVRKENDQLRASMS